MDFKRVKTVNSTITRDIQDFSRQTGNLYETIVMLSKRANQISSEMKQDLHKKIEEYANSNDSLEEVLENREQIEIVKFYEQLPKPTLIAVKEYLTDNLYYRNPDKEEKDEMHIVE